MKRGIRDIIRSTLADEEGYFKKEPGGRLNVALVYPNFYHIGMSNLAIHAIYRIINNCQDALCERAFLPDKETEGIYRNAHIPLVTFESQRPVKEFDVLAFSCSYENDYLNILKILDLASIPIWANERDESFPLVIMGGVCTFFNVEPISPFIDCFLCGEGEVLINDFLNIYRSCVGSNSKRHDLLINLASIEGAYCPRFYHYKYDQRGRIQEIVMSKGVKRRITPQIEKGEDLIETSTTIYNKNSEFGHMYLLEVTRGCPRGCHFCLLSCIYRPFRQRNLETLLNSVKKGLEYRNVIGLVGASLTDYRDFLSLCKSILAMGGKFSASSIRIDGISDQLLEYLIRSGHKTLTIAPEAGSERLRKRIGKGDITEEAIMTCISKIAKWGIVNLKLYFMIGFPDETEEDVHAIINLIKKIRHQASQITRGEKRLRQITISVNSLIPKPLTKFQYYPMESVEILNQKINYIRKALKQINGTVFVHDLPKWSFVQALLSRGDRRVAEILYHAFLENGNWKKAFKGTDINPFFYTYRKIEDDEIPPWGLWTKHF